jgi:hypothetical protein
VNEHVVLLSDMCLGRGRDRASAVSENETSIVNRSAGPRLVFLPTRVWRNGETYLASTKRIEVTKIFAIDS